MHIKLSQCLGPSPAHRSEFLRTLWFLSLAALFIVVSALMDGAADFHPAQLLVRPWPILLNALPGVMLALLILVLSRRALFSFWVAGLAYAGLDAINGIKVANLRTPLLPQDIGFLKMIDANSIHLLGAYAGSLWLIAVGVAAVVGLSCVLFAIERPLFARGLRGRAPSAVLLTCGLLLMGPLGNGWRHLYGSGSYFTTKIWSPLATVQRSGLVNGLIFASIKRDEVGRLPPPSVSKAAKLLQRYAGQVRAGMAETGVGGVRPDIVIIQSEAFFDPSVLNRVDPGSVLPHFHAWQAQAATGRLHVPTFGGGTIRTEFEVLTGISLNSLPTVEYPYLQLSSTKLEGLVSVLNRHGYDTHSIHANDGGFWNRESTFRDLGFKHQTWKDGFSKQLRYEGLYVSDETMTDQIITELERRDSASPRFVFAISIENHGPYNVQPHIDWNAWKAIHLPPGLGEQAGYDFRSYLYHLNHVDTQLDRLLHYVMASARPTIVVFYGDHLPALGPVFDQLGFRDGGDVLTQPVPWLMVTNEHNPALPSGDLAAWMLPGLVLHAAGIDDDPFFTLKRMLPTSLAELTHSPWAESGPGEKAVKRDELLPRLANIDRLRLAGRLSEVFEEAAGGRSVRVDGSDLGAYVTQNYEVGGIARDFPSDSPLFARVELVGKAHDLPVRVLLRDKDKKIVRQASVLVDVDGRVRVNLDLRNGETLAPGVYGAETLLGDEVTTSYNVTLH